MNINLINIRSTLYSIKKRQVSEVTDLLLPSYIPYLPYLILGSLDSDVTDVALLVLVLHVILVLVPALAAS